MENTTLNKIANIASVIMLAGVVDIETATEPQMKKSGNPYLGRVKKHTAYLGVDFGTTYAEEVNKRRLEEGKSADFVANKSPYEEIEGNPYFVCKGEQTYLRVLLNKDCKTKTIWEIDERPATEQEIAEIKGFLYSKGAGSGRQGLDESKVEMRVIKTENIVAVGNEQNTWHI